jgi:hypothetical protein
MKTTALTGIITLILMGLSLAGLGASDYWYPDPDLRSVMVPNDAVVMGLGLPLLLAGLALWRRRRSAGLLVLSGALLYLTYSLIPAILLDSASVLLWPRLALTLMSAATLIFLLVLEGAGSHRRQSGPSPRLLPATVLLLLTVVCVARSAGLVAAALSNGLPIPAGEQASLVADLICFIPTMPVAAILLLRRHRLAPVLAGAMLVAYGTLSASLIPFLAIQSAMRQTAFDPAAALIVGAMAIICAIPVARIIRAG